MKWCSQGRNTPRWMERPEECKLRLAARPFDHPDCVTTRDWNCSRRSLTTSIDSPLSNGLLLAHCPFAIGICHMLKSTTPCLLYFEWRTFQKICTLRIGVIF